MAEMLEVDPKFHRPHLTPVETVVRGAPPTISDIRDAEGAGEGEGRSMPRGQPTQGTGTR
jgi:hypothetical protein